MYGRTTKGAAHNRLTDIKIGLGTIEQMHNEAIINNYEYMMLATQLKIVEALDDITSRLEALDSGK